MTYTLSRAQIRGARAMLGWSLLDLAKAAHLSVATIRRAENGWLEFMPEQAEASIRDTLESEGVRFLPDDGDGPGMRLKER